MNNKVFVVTGATSGIGKAAALALAKTGATVVMIAHDEQRGAQAQKQITTAAQNPNVELELGDLGNLSSVRNIASIVTHRYNKIDGLVNSASVYKKNRVLTVDGYETMFATNHLGPFLLTYLLLDQLMSGESARIINITAPATTTLNFDDLQGEKQFNSFNAFGASKMANLLFTYELARRMENTGVKVNAFHPGLVRSQLMKESFAPIRWLSWLAGSSPDRVGKEIADLVTAPEFEDVNSKFMHHGKEIDPPAYALDISMQKRLWEVSEQLAGITPPVQEKQV